MPTRYMLAKILKIPELGASGSIALQVGAEGMENGAGFNPFGGARQEGEMVRITSGNSTQACRGKTVSGI